MQSTNYIFTFPIYVYQCSAHAQFSSQVPSSAALTLITLISDFRNLSPKLENTGHKASTLNFMCWKLTLIDVNARKKMVSLFSAAFPRGGCGEDHQLCRVRQNCKMSRTATSVLHISSPQCRLPFTWITNPYATQCIGVWQEKRYWEPLIMIIHLMDRPDIIHALLGRSWEAA